jgi:2-dehydro-3-deoxyphosphooctonate aldolase (KDO 8-P synthase)
MIKNTKPMHIREGVVLGSDKPVLFSGPCAVESYDICLEIGTKVKAWADENGFSYVFKASFDKANRTSSGSFRSIGMDKSLEVLQSVIHLTSLWLQIFTKATKQLKLLR